MVDWIFVGIGGVGTAMGLFFAKHYHSKYKRANERTVQVRKLQEDTRINL